MDYLKLKGEILANPKCNEYIVTPDMPKDSKVFAKDSAIASILSTGRKKVISREVGDGAISLALGIPAGPIFLYKLKKLAAAVLPDDATDEQIAPVAIAQQVVASLAKTGLDVGDPQIRSGISLLSLLLTVGQMEAIKALAEVDDVISAAEVSLALRGPWE